MSRSSLISFFISLSFGVILLAILVCFFLSGEVFITFLFATPSLPEFTRNFLKDGLFAAVHSILFFIRFFYH
jgi:hypothetical protein